MESMYEDGTYLSNNPTWHQEDSAWKAAQVTKIIRKNGLTLGSIGEIGCGAGEVLCELDNNLSNQGIQYLGYEISPQAHAICITKSRENLKFQCEDLLTLDTPRMDLVMALDVFEHVEDYMGFLRKLKEKAKYKVFHIPLDLSVQSVLRSRPIMNARQSVGHLHYFTKETALATLQDTGYRIVDYTYTSGAIELTRGRGAALLKLPRKLLFMISPDLAARILGGFSLLVLAE